MSDLFYPGGGMLSRMAATARVAGRHARSVDSDDPIADVHFHPLWSAQSGSYWPSPSGRESIGALGYDPIFPPPAGLSPETPSLNPPGRPPLQGDHWGLVGGSEVRKSKLGGGRVGG